MSSCESELLWELGDVEPHHGHVALVELIYDHVGRRVELLSDNEHRAGGGAHDADA
ncbi:hypothetical protein [Streptomyces sp. NPDC001970]